METFWDVGKSKALSYLGSCSETGTVYPSGGFVCAGVNTVVTLCSGANELS